MRLPQSILRNLFVRRTQLLTGVLTGSLVGILSVTAAAATAQLTCTPSGFLFGTVAVGQTETLMTTVSNNGLTSVTISEITVSNTEFTISPLSLPAVLGAGQSVDMNVSFTPGAKGWTSGTIKFKSNASNPTLQIEVQGTGVTSEGLTVSPATVSFGQVAVGRSSTVPVVLQNVRSWKVILLGINTAGSGFSISGATFPLTLGVGQSVSLNVTFTPQSAGTTGGSLFVSGPATAIPLTGTGTVAGQLSVSPAPLNFGNVPVGTTATEPITMSAAGASVTVSSDASNSSQFVLEGASLPFTIPAGQSVSFNIAFTPKSGGTVSGALTFVSNAANSQTIESLSGMGTVTSYTVNIWWNSTPDVVGYNVYRSTAANGTYLKMNTAVDPNTAYSDSTVASGSTYYYAATSVNSSGQESGRSAPPVVAAVP